MKSKPPTIDRKLLAWAVHALTASGLIVGFMAILAINAGDWRLAMLWLFVAFFIDGIDGTLARLVNVKQVLPRVNGTMIDTVVDFANYAIIPAYLLHESEVLPPSLKLLSVAIILLSSALYYGKEGMVSDDMYFVGFPVLWNIIAFFIVFLPPSNAHFNFIAIAIFGILHFVPLKYAYPSRRSKTQKPDLVFALLLFITMVVTTYQYPEVNTVHYIVAYSCAAYFMGMAVYNTYFRSM